jgi:hypothetical protein
VVGRRWFDKVNGNTYHKVYITDAESNNLIYESPHVVYGYDDAYRQTALSELIKLGLLSESNRFNHELIRKVFYFNVVDVSRKRDL